MTSIRAVALRVAPVQCNIITPCTNLTIRNITCLILPRAIPVNCRLRIFLPFLPVAAFLSTLMREHFPTALFRMAQRKEVLTI